MEDELVTDTDTSEVDDEDDDDDDDDDEDGEDEDDDDDVEDSVDGEEEGSEEEEGEEEEEGDDGGSSPTLSVSSDDDAITAAVEQDASGEYCEDFEEETSDTGSPVRSAVRLRLHPSIDSSVCHHASAFLACSLSHTVKHPQHTQTHTHTHTYTRTRTHAHTPTYNRLLTIAGKSDFGTTHCTRNARVIVRQASVTH